VPVAAAPAYAKNRTGDSSLQPSERLYYSDSFLRTFRAEVTGVREAADNDGESLWQLSLDRTAFYPSSGGQPFDRGTLSALSQGGSALTMAVQQVEEDEDGAVWHFVRQRPAVGVHVEGQIDWQRRFDHMQQHTGQHLLSAVFLRELQAPTVSFHLGEDISTIDLAVGQPPTGTGLERVEQIANQIIGEDRPVTTRTVPRAEADAMLAEGELRKLPDRQGAIRLIEIAECDRNACGGTHVRSTGQIGGLLLRGMEKVSRGVRVEFVCGMRAVRAARADAAILRQTGALLSTGAAELPATIARLLADGKASLKERQKLREELATFEAAHLAMEAPVENGMRCIVRGWTDRDRDYVKLLASRTAACASSAAVIFSAKERDPARVVLARSADLDFDCGRILREALARLELRGGGSADLAQGEVPREKEPALLASLIESIRRAAGSHP
jgi:alanyl-tRNA synthetase